MIKQDKQYYYLLEARNEIDVDYQQDQRVKSIKENSRK